ncbi:CoA ester lyase [Ciceribacter sp. L1K22]|uniref:HpcH/HpaI aldolase/citrate lyase family protein n=1 Tax=Ciceribacter sp. L1K22 TaxID=2820275 RepID=UPI001ABE7C65|nr:CoA ester lyase [Ciceribacter sp. L1K22]MBO3758177.1 CoA ester lyase [Ciceribacter sp. L1K22]
MFATDRPHPIRLRRSLLSVPAINMRALDKSRGLDCDGVILDLEDSVAPDRKAEARDNLRGFFTQGLPEKRETVIRVNAADSPFFDADMAAVVALKPDAVLLPKVNEPEDVQTVADLLAEADVPDSLKIWAMMETPHGILNAAAIAKYGRTAGGRLECFVVGLNDLRKETGVLPDPQRTYLVPWLMQVILAGRAYGIEIIDSVYNDFHDLDAYARECAQGRAMGFDGKMLIHPAQIAAANAAFGPTDQDLDEARMIVAAFADPAAAGLNVINSGGRMIERLHLEQAERVVMKAALINDRKGTEQ